MGTLYIIHTLTIKHFECLEKHYINVIIIINMYAIWWMA